MIFKNHYNYTRVNVTGKFIVFLFWFVFATEFSFYGLADGQMSMRDKVQVLISNS